MIRPTPYLIEKFADRYYRQRQIGFLFGLLVWSSFFVWDIQLFRTLPIFQELRFIRLEVAAPIIAILGLLTFVPRLKRDLTMSLLGCGAILTAWCGLVYMLTINSPKTTLNLYVPGLLTILLYHFAMFRHRWKIGAATGVLFILIFNLAGHVILQDTVNAHLGVSWFSANSYMASFVIIGSLLCYQIENTFYVTETQRLELEAQNIAVETSQKEAHVAMARAEMAYQERTSFLLQTSHDLRQPMQAIKYYVKGLGDSVKSPPEAEVVAKLYRAVRSMDELYKGLHDFNRLGADAITVDRVACYLPLVIEEEVNNCMPLAVEKGISLRVHIGFFAWVETDYLLVRRILRNLLSNALIYTKQGGALVSLRKRGGDAYVQVFDTGEGIDANDLLSIFQPFVRLRPDGSRARRGLGLGLAIAEGMAQRIGTRISVRSQVDKGSSFGFRLPAMTQAVAATGFTAPVDPPGDHLVGSGRCVAVVDDDPEILEACKTLLGAAGYVVIDGRSWAELIERIRAQGVQPAILLADIELEGGEDAWLVHESLQRELGVPVPVVLITGAVTAAYRERADRESQTILQKPCEPEVLLDALDTTLKKYYRQTTAT